MLTQRSPTRTRQSLFPRRHGRTPVGDHRVFGGIVHVVCNGSRWRDAPEIFGPHKTLYNRFMRRSRMGVSCRILEGLVGEGPRPEGLIRLTVENCGTSRRGAESMA
jgi:transposase